MSGARVFAVYRNSDMTEGRGPMVLDSLWWEWAEAVDYINGRRGVMGREPFNDHAKSRAHVLANNPTYLPAHGWLGECTGWLCKQCWPYGGEWRIEEMPVR